ncbi:hypothetical protein BDZ45DRAFT_691838 [Acephala macrosclerotiorum]|nr:hypothetical protein BDZ45DRAFT_691838 [Acephala macrosclerotiorum]
MVHAIAGAPGAGRHPTHELDSTLWGPLTLWFLSKIEDERKNILVTLWKEKRIVSITLFIAFTQFQNGFDSAAVSGFQAIPGFLAVFGYVDPTNPIEYNLSTKVQTLIESLMQLGSLISCLFIFKFGFSLSRRLGIWIASLLSLISISIQIGTTNTVDNYTKADNGRISYQLPLATMYIAPATVGLGLIFLPDTPRYYVSIDQPSLALNSIRKLRGIKDETQLSSLVSEIEKGWQAEMELNSTTHLKDIFKGNNLRRTHISAGCAIAQAASGMIFLSSLVYFFVQARTGSPFVWVMIALSIALTGNMLSFPAVRFLNRRFLLIISSVVNSGLMFAMAIVYTASIVGSP